MEYELSRAPWVIVAGGFHFQAGQAKAVAWLAEHLAQSGVPLHLVGNQFAPSFHNRPSVILHRTPLPLGVQSLGNFFTARVGYETALRVTRESPGSRVVVVGGNCSWADVNWVHYLHHAWRPQIDRAPVWYRLKAKVVGAIDRRRERLAINSARLVIANSLRTKQDIVQHLGTPADRVRVVYLGADESWCPPSNEERQLAREEFHLPPNRPAVVFVGGFGYDNRKGSDTLLAAWQVLCNDPTWDAVLLMAGSGPASQAAAKQVRDGGLAERVLLLGHTDRVLQLLAAADLLVSPVRYEAYGLNVHEALCRGVPAIVSAVAGVVEHYPLNLRDLLLQDPNSVEELVRLLKWWRNDLSGWSSRAKNASGMSRARSWEDMAREIVAAVECS